MIKGRIHAQNQKDFAALSKRHVLCDEANPTTEETHAALDVYVPELVNLQSRDLGLLL